MDKDNYGPKELMIMTLNGNRRYATALVNIEDPLGYEVRDLDDIITLYQKYPFIPFFENADATLRFYSRMRKLSPTHSSIIQSLIRFVTGGKLCVVKKQQEGFSNFEDEESKVDKTQWDEYKEFLKEHIDTGQLLKDIVRAYDGYKTWGNAFIEVVMTRVAGIPSVQIHVHDADRCRYMVPKEDRPDIIGISPEWTIEYIDKYPPTLIPIYPNIGEFEDGTERTIFHLKNPVVGRKYYGEPDSIGCIFFQFLEYQLGSYTTEGYLNRWIAKVFIETFGDPEDDNQNKDFDNAVIDTFTQRGKNRKSVMVKNSPLGNDPTQVHEFKTQTDEKFHQAMAAIAENQILKAHNWNHLLLGVKISGQLGGGNEYKEVYKRKFVDKIQPEMEIILEPFRMALKLIEEFVGYGNPNELTIGLKDLYWKMVEDTASAVQEDQEEEIEDQEEELEEEIEE